MRRNTILCRLDLSESGAARNERWGAERRNMQVNSGVKVNRYMEYRKNAVAEQAAGKFAQMQERPDFTTGDQCGKETPEHLEVSLFTTGRIRELQNRLLSECVTVSAATETSCVEEGEFLGLTMVPEVGEELVYGMSAFLVESSTKDNPIVQIRSNLNGEKVYYNVEINKVDPKNATQLEMFALLSYTDKMGLTEGGSFGSFQKLQVYGMNASLNGYCRELSGVDTFLNERFDWTEILAKIMQDYMDAKLEEQYKDCKTLLNYFEEDEDGDYHQFIQDKIVEILNKSKKGETQKSYQIGSQSFTEDEWDKFLENFDSMQEVLKELIRERLEKKEEELLEKKREDKIREDKELEEEAYLNAVEKVLEERGE